MPRRVGDSTDVTDPNDGIDDPTGIDDPILLDPKLYTQPVAEEDRSISARRTWLDDTDVES